MKIKRIAIGSDHAGYGVKKALIPFLTALGYDVFDAGTHSTESCDYPDFAGAVAKSVAKKNSDRGLLVCGTGNGMAIAANKIRGIRAAIAWTPTIGSLASEHNWANVLCLPSRFISLENSKRIISAWLKTAPDMGGRHERRIKKVSKLEK